MIFYYRWLLLASILPAVLSLGNSTDKSQPKCTDKPGSCNQWTPCCNSEGWCGQGFSYCGQTCVGSSNYQGQKCQPPATCMSGDVPFNEDRIIHEDQYAQSGNFLKYDYRVRGDYEINDGTIILKMSKPNSGSSIQSSRYINYGRVSAEIKTSRGGGVVSSFITMSDTKDEIDFEWVGQSLTTFQSNWFSKGVFPVLPLKHDAEHPQANSFDDFHKYTIDWNQDRIQWILDDKIIRELANNGTDYPNTPSLFSFGIWDGGSGAEGTKKWSGGPIDWNSPDMKSPGYYTVHVRNVQVECYGPATSKDSDFVVDPKLGLMVKDDLRKFRAQFGSALSLTPLLIFSAIPLLVILII